MIVTLEDLQEIFGDNHTIVISRELTKRFEENNRGSIKLPSWGTADLGATYSFNLLGYDARARLNVNNLFDEEYLSQSQTNFHNDGGRTWNGINVENNVYFGKGTTWNLGLNINF